GLRIYFVFFISSRRRHTSFSRDWSSDVCSSDLPAAAIPAAIAVLAGAIAVLRREACRDAVLVELSADTVAVDGSAVASLSVAWRGPLAFMRWREPSGRTRRLVWWPDVLSTEARRRLRLATGRESSSPLVASVAP